MCVAIIKAIKLKQLILISFLSAIALILSWFKIAIPGPFNFIKFDFSLTISLYAILENGLTTGICIEFMYWALRLLTGSSSTIGIGQTIDLLIGLFAVVVLNLLLKIHKDKKSIYVSLFLSAFLTALWGVIVNCVARPAYIFLFGKNFIKKFFSDILLIGGIFNFLKVIMCGISAVFFNEKIKKFNH